MTKNERTSPRVAKLAAGDRPKRKRIPVTDTPAVKKRKPKTHKWTRHRR